VPQVALVYQPAVEASRALAQACQRDLAQRGKSAEVMSSRDLAVETAVDGMELVVTFGGDGTILRTARWLAGRRIPIVGVQMGRLGFLAELLPAELPLGLAPYAEGRFWLDERAMLEAEMDEPPAGATVQPDATTQRGFAGGDEFGALCAPTRCLALNDVVIGRGASPRTVTVEVRIDGNPLHQFRCDGLVVATATGSTAYSFAAGGPILAPGSTDLVITAICPHMSSLKSVVVPGNMPLQLRAWASDPPILSIDGQVDHPLANEQIVRARLSDCRTMFARQGTPTEFYSRILAKLD
jgi:NAD+ kinase